MHRLLFATVILTAATSFLLLFTHRQIEIVSSAEPVYGAHNNTHHTAHSQRRLQHNKPADESGQLRPEIHGKTVEGPSIIVNMLRRERERVSDTDVPFLLEVPHTSSDTIYNILSNCYGLKGRRYLNTQDLARDKELDAVNRHYVSAHVKPPEDEYFHFVSTPHYQEGAALFTREYRGRIMLMMRHPCEIAESMYLSRPGSIPGDVAGLLNYTMSPDYYDNWMTRMIANIPHSRAVTEQDFIEARKILENKFLIGMTKDVSETVLKRIKLYFGWRELPNQRGCEVDLIKKATASMPQLHLVELSHEWRQIRKINHFDCKLYARAQAMFAKQKMNMPVHELVSGEEKRIAMMSVQNLIEVTEPVKTSDMPFFWHIPKASGTTVKETLSDCYNLVRTEMIRPPSSLDVIKRSNVLNIDLSTPDAVVAARQMSLVGKGLADVFISQLVEAGTIFNPQHNGRAFTILRHPVKLAASLFYYRRVATWEPTYRPEYNDITLEEYVKMDGYYDNWMVRMLSNAKLGGLNKDHLELAKSVLEKKFFIGMAEHMDETFRQLETYYGWKEVKEGCVANHLHRTSNKNKYPELQRGGSVWEAIADKNKFDMALYYFALELFGHQLDRAFTRIG